MKILILNLLFLSQLASAQVTTMSGAEESIQNKTISGVDVNARDEHGKTPLHTAARDDKTKLVINLVEEGADVNALDNNGQTPLHIATLFFKIRPINFLLESGADANIKDKFDRTPLDLIKLKFPKTEAEKERQVDIIEALTNHAPWADKDLLKAKDHQELKSDGLKSKENLELRISQTSCRGTF